MRDYVLTIGIDKFYLTEDERDFYIHAVENGAKLVKLPDGRVLGTNPQSLVHKEVLKGKWKCEKGNFHNQGADCMCQANYTQLPSGNFLLEEK